MTIAWGGVSKLIRLNRPEYFGELIVRKFTGVYPPREWFRTDGGYQQAVRNTIRILQEELANAKSQGHADPEAIIIRIKEAIERQVFPERFRDTPQKVQDQPSERGSYRSPVDFGTDATEA